LGIANNIWPQHPSRFSVEVYEKCELLRSINVHTSPHGEQAGDYPERGPLRDITCIFAKVVNVLAITLPFVIAILLQYVTLVKCYT
jgi:hypothetical protein